MHTSLSTVRTAVTNRTDFAVMRDQIQMAKILVVAGGSGGTGKEAHRRTKVRPWTRVQARREFCGLQTPVGTTHACHRRMSREERQQPQPLEHWVQAEAWCSMTWEERQQPRPPAPSPPLGKGLRQINKKFRYKKVTHREIVEDKVTPRRTQGYIKESHREMMEEDQEMTPWRTPRIRQLLSVMVIVIVNILRGSPPKNHMVGMD